MNDQTKRIQGMRNILYINVEAMHRDNKPEYTPCARVSPKFMKAMIGPKKDTVTVQRGFRQYGQPCDETLNAIVDIVDKDEDKAYEYFRDKLCTCGCDFCTSASPHSVYSCAFQCSSQTDLSEANKQKMGLYETCECSCFE